MSEKERIGFSGQLRRFGVRSVDFVRVKGKQNMIIFIALIVLVAVFYALNPNFLKSSNILSMTQSLAPYAIMALGVTFVIATGGIDLSIGTVCIASAVVAGKLAENSAGKITAESMWIAIPIMIVVGTLFGLINGVLIAKLKIPAFIATLGTMMLARGLSALIVRAPNIFFPTGTWFNSVFSNANGVPTGLFWVLGLMLLCMYMMYKNKIGRYILSIGSNEEATRLSGIDTDKYKILAYTFSGLGAGIAAIFWSASFATVASATGNGMELDAIAGVYIGGTSAAGGVASVLGSIIGSAMLVVIRSGLNFVLAKMNLDLNATYVTYVLTGIIVVVAVLMDVAKNKHAGRVSPKDELRRIKARTRDEAEKRRRVKDAVKADRSLSAEQKKARLAALDTEIEEINNQGKEALLQSGSNKQKK